MDTQYLTKEFFKVSNHVFELRLSPTEFLVYCFLSSCHEEYNPSRTQIAKRTGLSKITVIRALKELRLRGLIVPNGVNKQFDTKKYLVVRDFKNEKSLP